MYAKFGDNQTIFGHLKIGGTESGTYRNTESFLLFWGCERLISSQKKKILGQLEKITDGMHHGIMCPNIFGRITTSNIHHFM